MSPRFITRAGVVSVVSFLTIITGMQASADVLNPQADDGSSGSGAVGSAVLDEVDRSVALIELSGGTASASINGRGTVPLAETEHVLAAASSGDDAASVHHPTANETSIRLIESLYAEGGELAGGEPEVAAQPNRGQAY